MENLETIKLWYEEVWNNKNENFIDKILAEDCVAHGLFDESGNEIAGREKFKTLYRKFIASFPDIHFKIVATVNEGDKIAALADVSFTHSGTEFEAFPGKVIAPSGNLINISGITITVIRERMIREAWNSFDFLSLYAQLGAF